MHQRHETDEEWVIAVNDAARAAILEDPWHQDEDGRARMLEELDHKAR